MNARKPVIALSLIAIVMLPMFVGWDCSSGTRNVLPLPSSSGRTNSGGVQGVRSPSQAPGVELVRIPVGPPSELPAFPGAEGYGTKSVGGRGPGSQTPRIIHVTTLQDQERDRITGQLRTTPGSLREALEASGPRFVIFDVSGPIVLSSELSITNPYITVAGQTAPGTGIAILHHGLRIRTHDVVLRHLRFRLYFDESTDWLTGRDMNGLLLYKNDSEMTSPSAIPVTNIVIDHCSISWAPANNFTTWNWVKDITIQWSIISEASVYGCDYGPQGFAWLSNRSTTSPSPNNLQSATLHHNLFANNGGRQPSFTTGRKLDFRNNVVYNWDNSHPARFQTSVQVNFVGNTYLAGVDVSNVTAIQNVIKVPLPDAVGGALPILPRLYIRDNLSPLRRLPTADDWSIGVAYYRINSDGSVCHAPIGANCVLDVSQMGQRWLYELIRPIDAPLVTTHAADAAKSVVLTQAGATSPQRDLVDARIVDEVNYVSQIRPFDNPPPGYDPLQDPKLHHFGPNSGSRYTIVHFQPIGISGFECLPRVNRVRNGMSVDATKRDLLSRITYTFSNGHQLPRDVELVMADPVRYPWSTFEAVVPDETTVRSYYPANENPSLAADTDGDGVPNTFEKLIGTNPYLSDSLQDVDRDGYLNVEEYINYMATLSRVTPPGGNH